MAAEVRAVDTPRPPNPSSVPSTGGAIIGQSTAINEMRSLLERIRNSNATVLITGENGTGKELVAKQIHAESSRAGGPFVAVNVSAFNDNLLESELFGHKKGAFTDATTDKLGLFQVADGGTFFMDEVGDMSQALQVKLLRVLQDGSLNPVGGTTTHKVNVRVVAATNRSLQAMVSEGKFREDLYYRLNVVNIRVPALRERMSDIPLLVAHFLNVLSRPTGTPKTLHEDAMRKLMTHNWPGNVRELENEIERAWVLSGNEPVISEAIVLSTPRRRMPGTEDADLAVFTDVHRSLPEAVEALERKMITSALTKSKGNKTRAAEALGISRRNLIRKVQSYGLESLMDPTGGETE